jgi:hypothetical protein
LFHIVGYAGTNQTFTFDVDFMPRESESYYTFLFDFFFDPCGKLGDILSTFFAANH